MATKAEMAALTERYQAALDTIERLSRDQAVLAGQAGASLARAPMMHGQLVVGIRNVSNNTVGMIDNSTGKPVEYSLHAEVAGVHDPKVRAVISYVFWQMLRTGKFVGEGMIIRDDSVLGDADNLAPPDRPEDMHPDASKNIVLDPRAWILGQTEGAMRQAVAAMTSESTLRRVIQAVDEEVYQLGLRYTDDPEQARKAVRDLSGTFRIAEELCYERLDELNPLRQYRDAETAPMAPRGSRLARA